MAKISTTYGMRPISFSRRRVIGTGALAAGALLLPSLPAFAQEKPKVGLVMKSLANEFFKRRGHARAARHHR